MFLQGDLQQVFDALFQLGVIDPALEMDWKEEFEEIERNPIELARVVNRVNENMGDTDQLMEVLKEFEMKELSHLAMLVAKELVGFHSNKTVH